MNATFNNSEYDKLLVEVKNNVEREALWKNIN